MKRTYLAMMGLSLLIAVICGCLRAPRKADAAPFRRPQPTVGTGLDVTVTEVAAAPDSGTGANPTAPSTPLSSADVQKILARLPGLTPLGTDKQALALRPGSLPPPLTGRTIRTPFPPLQQATPPPVGASGPLEVLRHGPEGDVKIAPELSMTFSQAMVPLSSLAVVEAHVPASIEPPAPSGKWRWLGTRTLEYAPTGRFPMATRWQVTVPAGTQSLSGGRLPQAVTWTFTTPPPGLETSEPRGSSIDLNPVMVIVFDQAIQAADVLPTIHLHAGQTEVPLRLATEAEVQGDERAREVVKAAMKGRFVAVRASAPLPAATSCEVVIGPGTPSAEGPLRTTSAQQFEFDTYGPLTIEDYSSRDRDPVSPRDTWYLRLSNPLKDVPPGAVQVSPALPGLKVDFSGNVITLRGTPHGRTDYTVTVDTTVADIYGQHMAKPQSVVVRVGSAPRSLTSQGGPLVILDPDGGAHYSIYTVNEPALKVRLYSESVDDWNTLVPFVQHIQDDQPRLPPGHLQYSATLTPKAEADVLTETSIDLKPALHDGFGQVLVIVQPAEKPENEWQERTVVAWVQVTHIGLDAVVDAQKMIGWASALHNGAPLAGVQLSVAGSTGLTDADGLARLELPAGGKQPNVLVARQGADLAFLPQSSSWWSQGGWYRQPLHDTLRWFIFDDRKLYRPGETVHLKGWMRRLGAGPRGDVGALQGAVDTIRYVVTGPQGNELLKGTCKPDPLGGFQVAFPLPPHVNLGSASVRFTAVGTQAVAGTEAYHAFDIQEFRRPEFEVTAHAASEVGFVGEQDTVALDAHYYPGGGLAGAPVRWDITSTPTFYSPPNTDGFSFGRWTPWWQADASGGDGPSGSKTLQGRTDAAGHDTIRLDFGGVTPPRPMSVRIEGNVTDVNRQAWSASAAVLVHPSRLYVGLKSDRSFVQPGEDLKVAVLVVDVDGKKAPGTVVHLHIARQDWASDEHGYHEVEADPHDQTVTSADAPVYVDFKTGEGGTYKLIASVADRQGRPNESEFTLWVAGGKQPPQRSVEQQTVTLIPDRRHYVGGQTAAILVQAPFLPAEGLLTISRSGIIETRPFHMDSASMSVSVPIEDVYTPNVQVQVDMVGSAPRTDDDGHVDPKLGTRPAYATGTVSLSVPPTRRALHVAVQPAQAALAPGAVTSLDVQLQDAGHHPIQGQVALVVVDEAVLALSGYSLPNPMDTFYSARDSGIGSWHSRQNLLLSSPVDVLQEGNKKMPVGHASGVFGSIDAPAPPPAAAPMERAKSADKDEEQEKQKAPAIALRTNMSALALFAPHVQTDAAGHARVPFKLPDNLTRYRIMVVAVAGSQQFGDAHSSLTARLPLMVRPSPPRFLNFGDRFELPVVVQNQTDAPMSVSVAVRGTNLQWPGAMGQRVTVPANNRVEIRFPASTVEAGTARIQVAGVSATASDAAFLSLPVWTPATSEAFATYGVVDDQTPVVQAVQAPPDVFPQFGGLSVTTSSTALASLTDAMLYLQAYPFECAEQVSSRVLGVAALRDVLAAFQAPGLPSPKQMQAAMARDIERLQGFQNSDGGFGFWHQGETSWPYISIHVAHALQVAKLKGYPVADATLKSSAEYLRHIEEHIPAWYGINCRRALIAYALNVRSLMGEDDAAQARKLVDEAGASHLSVEAMAWVLPILSRAGATSEVADLRRALENQATETASDASFTVAYEDGEHLLLASNRRADAVVLDALVQADPNNSLVPKLVSGLLGHRQKGRWDNTQENVFILLALDRYFQTFEKLSPDFVARVWLGDAYAGDHRFVGHTTERHEIDIPLRSMAARSNLILGKTGPGRLYYRMGLEYAPKNLTMPPTDEGFSVQRLYESIDHPTDVRRDGDGTWHIKAGARVRIALTMVAQSRRYHVALVDPLPAGLESMNPELQVTGTIPQQVQDRPYGWWWTDTWFEHQNLRDNRTEAFTSLLWEGVYHYTYVARATTPGTFVVPPTKAEEMYHPETFGRGSSDRVVVQ